MVEWWHKHIELLIEYHPSEEIINNAINTLKVMTFREGAKEFLENMKNRNIPIIIISAGIGNFIKQFLIKNNCNFNNIYIVSNFLKFENGIATGITENIIHSLNKNEISLPENIKKIIEHRQNIILLGDSISDINMAKNNTRKNILKIGFLEENINKNRPYYEKQFDIVCTNNTGYSELSEKLSILKNDIN